MKVRRSGVIENYMSNSSKFSESENPFPVSFGN